MCQSCYNRGFTNYPEFDSHSVPHAIDYIDGFKTKQRELACPNEKTDVAFCDVCYKFGKHNSKIGIWAPPLTEKAGHLSAYEKGYYEGDDATENEPAIEPIQEPAQINTILSQKDGGGDEKPDEYISDAGKQNMVSEQPEVYTINPFDINEKHKFSFADINYTRPDQPEKPKTTRKLVLGLLLLVVFVAITYYFVVKIPPSGLQDNNKSLEPAQIDKNPTRPSTAKAIEPASVKTDTPPVVASQEPATKVIASVPTPSPVTAGKNRETPKPQVAAPALPNLKPLGETPKPKKEDIISKKSTDVKEKKTLPIAPEKKTGNVTDANSPNHKIKVDGTGKPEKKTGGEVAKNRELKKEHHKTTTDQEKPVVKKTSHPLKKHKKPAKSMPAPLGYIDTSNNTTSVIDSLKIKRVTPIDSIAKRTRDKITGVQQKEQVLGKSKSEKGLGITKKPNNPNSDTIIIKNKSGKTIPTGAKHVDTVTSEIDDAAQITQAKTGAVVKEITQKKVAQKAKPEPIAKKKPEPKTKKHKPVPLTPLQPGMFRLVEDDRPFKQDKIVAEFREQELKEKVAPLPKVHEAPKETPQTTAGFSMKEHDDYTTPKASSPAGRVVVFLPADESRNEENEHESYGGKYLFTSFRLVTDFDISKLTPKARAIMMNEILARHNQIFHDETMKDYFSKKYWYSAETENAQPQLSEIEKKNIEFLKSRL